MKKVLTIVGARPQFVKAAVVSRAIAATDGIEEVLVHTGQHYDHGMSEVFFEEMDIPHPKYNLGINGVGHGAMTGRMLEAIEEVLLKEQPDVLMVYGDTNSTIAGALAARKLGITVAHVEAGLRSFNMAMPEEINRVLTDRISDCLYCPTQTAVENLQREGYDHLGVAIENMGDVMLDAALFYAEKARLQDSVIDTLNLGEKPFVLATVHRQENVDDSARLLEIFKGLDAIQNEMHVVMPLHPRTANALEANGLQPNIQLIDPVSYFGMLQLLEACEMVVTDSGGLQKEAFFFKKYCLTARDQTEWVELIDHGVNKLVGASAAALISGFSELRSKANAFDQQLYGDGHAAERIVQHLLNLR